MTERSSRPGPVGPDGRGGPHAFVADLGSPQLDDVDRHHFERALRLRPGDPLTVSDGQGGWRACHMGADLEVVGEVHRLERPEPLITIGFAPVKGDRPEWVVQKLTELGVDRIVALRTERSVVRWDGERADRQLERLRRVAREAAMQSRRCDLPEVVGMSTLAEVASIGVVSRAERGGTPPTLARPTVMIGPEGGWTDAERDLILETVDLGVQVLRAETAAMAAATLLTALREGLITTTT